MDLMTAYCVFKTLCITVIAIPVIRDMVKDWRKSPTMFDTSDKVNV